MNELDRVVREALAERDGDLFLDVSSGHDRVEDEPPGWAISLRAQ